MILPKKTFLIQYLNRISRYLSFGKILNQNLFAKYFKIENDKNNSFVTFLRSLADIFLIDKGFRYTFSSNHNIHKSSCGLCFQTSYHLIYRFNKIYGSKGHNFPNILCMDCGTTYVYSEFYVSRCRNQRRKFDLWPF